MLFLFLLVIVGVVGYLISPTYSKKDINSHECTIIVRQQGKIFTPVDTSTYGRVQAKEKYVYQESHMDDSEAKFFDELFK